MLFFKQIIDNVGLNFHDLTKKLTSNTNGMIHLKNSIIYGKSTLVRDNLIEIADGLFDDSKEIKLTQNAIDVFSENNIHDGKKIMTNKPRELISYESLKVNPLVHNPAEKQQIQQLESILQEENYNHLISKLQEKNYYTCGITVIFSGLAGTSKTMSCLTLAKNTRRDVFFVDISTVRSMWFGQSEKQLKALFQTYRRLVDESERAPIMFIDEADSLISKRVSVERTLDLTSNTLQNILLLEIQNLKGILIAASNLIGINNVDPAYERRFLFKVKFEKPGYVERKAIWTLNIPQLPNQQIEKLANEFNSFSGAEIENCSKRFILQETLQNKQPTFQELIDMCNQERFQSSEKSGKIGY
jgi:AAA+ superfamily predicted ATPase